MLQEFPIGLDCETTGTDIWHGCRPFFISTCHLFLPENRQRFWEWDVDPFTREPSIPESDIYDLYDYVNSNRFVYHNRKFEQRALQSIGVTLPNWDDEDTLIASHTIKSSGSHKLKDLALDLCDIPIDDQKELQQMVNECRRYARSKGWRIAKEGDPHFPAMKPKKDEGWWVMDMWLPRAVAKDRNLYPEHPYWSACKRYAMLDARRTAELWTVYYEALNDEDLIEQYITRRALLETSYTMEQRGITVSRGASEKAILKYGLVAERAEARCISTCRTEITNLGSSKQLQKVLYGEFGIEPSKVTKTGYSTDKESLKQYLKEARPNSKQHIFLSSLLECRQNSTGVNYLRSYEKFACGFSPKEYGEFLSQYPQIGDEYYLLHPSVNITGTRTTRASSSEPNEQNISKQEGFNLREVFCPLPGREWYSADYSNIEMRIFAYESGDKRLIEAFESGYKVHLIFAEILYPEQWAHCQRNGLDFSQVYESTWYQWVKNGNFALIYGAQKDKADRTYHLSGAYEKIRSQLPLVSQLMERKDEEAKRYGYVTTLGGYRLYVPRKRPHVAVNYYIQGSAGWYLALAMNSIHEYLRDVPDHHMIMTVHDELDFDFPIQQNYKIISDIADIMEESGTRLGIPVPVSVERHSESWAKGVKLDKLCPTWRTSGSAIAS